MSSAGPVTPVSVAPVSAAAAGLRVEILAAAENELLAVLGAVQDLEAPAPGPAAGPAAAPAHAPPAPAAPPGARPRPRGAAAGGPPGRPAPPRRPLDPTAPDGAGRCGAPLRRAGANGDDTRSAQRGPA